MSYTWFKIFNLIEFLALELPSQNLLLELEGLGEKEILVTRGNETGILYEGTFLTLNFNGNNPFAFEGMAVYQDANSDVWMGFEIES